MKIRIKKLIRVSVCFAVVSVIVLLACISTSGMTLYTEYVSSYRNTFDEDLVSYVAFDYSDNLFDTSSTDNSIETVGHLSKASMALAAATYRKAHIKSILEDMGYTIVAQVNYNSAGTTSVATKSDNDIVAYTIAKKDVYEILGGYKYSVYVIAVMGTNGNYEWVSNFKMGEGDTHEGFSLATDKLYSSLSINLSDIDKSNDKIWIMGHSRGAAVTNLLAAKLSRTEAYASLENIYAYTYACPATTKNIDGVYNNIRNYNNAHDFVVNMPLADWGYSRYGVTINLTDSSYDYDDVSDKFESLTGDSYDGMTSVHMAEVESELLNYCPTSEDYFKTYYCDGKINSPLAVFINVGAALADTSSWSTVSTVKTALSANDPAADVLQCIVKHAGHITHAHSPELYIAWMDVEGDISPYVVNHVKEGVDSTGVIADSEYIYARTGSKVTPPVKSYDGFSSPSTQTITVTAEEQKTVTYTYTRNSYTLTCILDGEEYGTYSFKYGETIAWLRNPYVPKGHNFTGWIDMPETMPAQDLTVYGYVQPNEHTVTYCIDGEVYASEKYLYGDSISLLEPENKEGYTFSGWDATPTVMQDSDITLNGSYVPNQYKAYYYVDSVEYYVTDTYYGEIPELPEAPHKDDFVFLGWSPEVEAMGAEYAYYEAIFAPAFLEVTFLNGDGSVLEKQTVAYGVAATEPEEIPYLADGYSFCGWDKDFSSVTEDMTLTPLFEQELVGVLKVNISGGSGFTMKVGEGIARPQGSFYLSKKMPIGTYVTLTAFSTSSETFVGWINANNVVVSTEEEYTFGLTGNDVLTAVYLSDLDAVHVVFYNNKSNQILDSQYYAQGEEIQFPDEAFYPGYSFEGWSMTQEDIAESMLNSTEVTITPVFEKLPIYYELTVIGGSAEGAIDDEGKVLNNTKVTVTADNPSEGYKFAYWIDGDGEIRSYSSVYSTYLAQDTVLTAVFVTESTEIDEQIITRVTSITPDTVNDTITFMYEWSVPEDHRVTLAGIILTNDSSLTNEEFLLGGLGVLQGRATIYTDTGTWSATKTSVVDGDVWRARAYLIYVDSSGISYTQYGPIVEYVYKKSE